MSAYAKSTIKPVSAPQLCRYGKKCRNPIGCGYSHPPRLPFIFDTPRVCNENDRCSYTYCPHNNPCRFTEIFARNYPSAKSYTEEIPCRNGVKCDKSGCKFAHPPGQSQSSLGENCNFDMNCNNPFCTRFHPDMMRTMFVHPDRIFFEYLKMSPEQKDEILEFYWAKHSQENFDIRRIQNRISLLDAKDPDELVYEEDEGDEMLEKEWLDMEVPEVPEE